MVVVVDVDRDRLEHVGPDRFGVGQRPLGEAVQFGHEHDRVVAGGQHGRRVVIGVVQLGADPVIVAADRGHRGQRIHAPGVNFVLKMTTNPNAVMENPNALIAWERRMRRRIPGSVSVRNHRFQCSTPQADLLALEPMCRSWTSATTTAPRRLAYQW